MKSDEITAAPGSDPLIRGVGVVSATALNMTDMIGVGPFITIPLIITAMGGPQAMLGWIFGALFAMCGGLVWAELGPAIRGLEGLPVPGRLRPQPPGPSVSFLFTCNCPSARRFRSHREASGSRGTLAISGPGSIA
jgi:hypothetical protein